MAKKKIIAGIVGIFIIISGSFALVSIKNEKAKALNVAVKIFNAQEAASRLDVVSFISPHHLVADSLIDEIFSEVSQKNAGKKIDRIILMSPDHFNKKSGWGFIADRNWNIDGEEIMADKLIAKKISEIGFILKNDELFSEEHGITALLPYVGKYFPGVKILPVMLKNELSKEKAEQLAEFFNGLDGNSLLILSSDFSHYLDKNISAFHDKKAIEVISNFSFDNVYNLETDFVSGLYVLMEYSRLKGFEKFHLMKNSNSSEIYNHDFIGENTSYVTGYFGKGAFEKAKKSVNFLFLGDLMLDRYTRKIIEKKGINWMTKNIERLFWGQDMNIVNLEGPMTENESVAIGAEIEDKNHFKFTFDPQNAMGFLKNNQIGAVNIGNNHILNFGKSGLEETKKNLIKSEVEYFGDPLDKNNFLVKEINGLKIALVNYNQFSQISAEETGEIIKLAKEKSDFAIVYTHWGNEYQLNENKAQREKAHRFIDVGADLVIGSHPHVVEPLEIYQGKMIFYSLGNFVFDQYFSEDTKTMLAVGIRLSPDNIEVVLTPLYQNNNGQIELADVKKRQVLLERLAKYSRVDNSVKDEIIKGKIKIQNSKSQIPNESQ